MGDKISLLMAIHCHQPVGNFDSVFEFAYEKSYLPFIEVLERHPAIRLALHYTGPLLKWLETNRPEFLLRIKGLVERGQVELLSGGFYEPILTLLREDDALSQIDAMNRYLQDKFECQARGAWLAERIWEPKIPLILNKAGIRFTIVDDSHFASVGRDVESLDGYYVSEDEGISCFVFPTSERLRYFMPFKLPQETIDYLRSKMERGFRAITFGDDGEKFGLWPGTYKWVYEEHWLDNFFAAIEACEWIETRTFSDYIASHSPTGQIYLPCVSYREMLEWSNGYFRNFMIKYPESNRMHKRMLLVSRDIAFLDSSHQAKDYLYRAQCNCGYWHGVFGGLYLNHLRSAVYSNLILAELASGLKYEPVRALDMDFDGKDEIILVSDRQNVFISHYGTVFEWDYKEKAVNISNVLTRRYESYHKKLKEQSSSGCSPDEVKSIHDLNVSNVKDLSVLQYDCYLRESAVDFIVKPGADIEDFYCHNHLYGQISFVNNSYLEGNKVFSHKGIWINDRIVELKKSFSLGDDMFLIEMELLSGDISEIEGANIGLEFNLSLFDDRFSSCKGRLKVPEKELWFKDKWYGINIMYKASVDFDMVYYPVETVSESEQGIETTFQGTCLVFLWPIRALKDRLLFEIRLG